jgi:hypothetical protein
MAVMKDAAIKDLQRLRQVHFTAIPTFFSFGCLYGGLPISADKRMTASSHQQSVERWARTDRSGSIADDRKVQMAAGVASVGSTPIDRPGRLELGGLDLPLQGADEIPVIRCPCDFPCHGDVLRDSPSLGKPQEHRHLPLEIVLPPPLP